MTQDMDFANGGSVLYPNIGWEHPVSPGQLSLTHTQLSHTLPAQVLLGHMHLCVFACVLACRYHDTARMRDVQRLTNSFDLVVTTYQVKP